MAKYKGKTVLFSPQIHISGTITEDATATAADILARKTAYAVGVKLTGTIQTYSGASEEISQ